MHVQLRTYTETYMHHVHRGNLPSDTNYTELYGSNVVHNYMDAKDTEMLFLHTKYNNSVCSHKAFRIPSFMEVTQNTAHMPKNNLEIHSVHTHTQVPSSAPRAIKEHVVAKDSILLLACIHSSQYPS